MSTITSAAAKNIFNFNKIFKRATPRPAPAAVNDDVEVFHVPEKYREKTSGQHYAPPPPVLGSVCRSQYDCSGALRAVCAADNNCRVSHHHHHHDHRFLKHLFQFRFGCNFTCQCPPHYYKKVNTYKPKPSHSYSSPLRMRRSLRYHEECVYDL